MPSIDPFYGLCLENALYSKGPKPRRRLSPCLGAMLDLAKCASQSVEAVKAAGPGKLPRGRVPQVSVMAQRSSRKLGRVMIDIVLSRKTIINHF